jgi:hypothetical protein
VRPSEPALGLVIEVAAAVEPVVVAALLTVDGGDVEEDTLVEVDVLVGK